MVSSKSQPSSSIRPCCGRTRPATKRNREDLPAPLGPVTRSASPAPTVKATPRKTSRPPLTQVRSEPTSRITCGLPARVHKDIGFPGSSPGSPFDWLPLLPGLEAEKTLISMPMSLASVDFLERHKKRPYKPSPPPPYQPALDSRPVTGKRFR